MVEPFSLKAVAHWSAIEGDKYSGFTHSASSSKPFEHSKRRAGGRLIRSSESTYTHDDTNSCSKAKKQKIYGTA